jgi:hypothetical protein
MLARLRTDAAVLRLAVGTPQIPRGEARDFRVLNTAAEATKDRDNLRESFLYNRNTLEEVS